MDSFSATDVTYPDGQTNRVVVPAEIQERGFKPPVRSSDGSLEAGSNLAANHLNFILHDIYQKFASSKMVVESLSSADGGFTRHSNGDIEMWGVGNPSPEGEAQITYPMALPDATKDIIVSIMAAESSKSLHTAMVVDKSQSTTGFKVMCKSVSASGGEVSASTNSFIWRSSYHAEVK